MACRITYAQVVNISPARHGLTVAIAAELRAEKGRQRLSQRALADLISRDQSYVSKRLNGQASLTVEEYVTLCQALGCRPDAVLRRALAQVAPVTPPSHTRRDVALAADDDPSYALEDIDADYDSA